MTKIILAVTAILLANGAAFAGSDHYGSESINMVPAPVAANIDHSFTAAIRKSVKPNVSSANDRFQSEPGQGIWGR